MVIRAKEKNRAGEEAWQQWKGLLFTESDQGGCSEKAACEERPEGHEETSYPES